MKYLKVVGFILLVFIIRIGTFANDIKSQNNNLLKQESNINTLLDAAECDDWKKVKQEKGVSISYRWLNFGDTLNTREISIKFIVNAMTEDVLINLRSKTALAKWNKGVRELNVYNNPDSSWVTHMIYDIPYPLSQQDLVTKNLMRAFDDVTIIDVKAEPDYIALIDNVNRQRFYIGQWKLTPLSIGKTEVSFSAVSFSKSNIPRFIRDPIIQNKLLSSFLKLKELSLKQVRVAMD